MRLKVVAIAIVLLLSLSFAFADYNGQVTLQYDFFFPQQSHLLNVRSDCLWGGETGFSFGFITTLGYGFEHYTQNGSNAIVYGPSFSLGPEIQYAFKSDLTLGAYGRAIADYALYPTILRGEAGLDIGYRIGDGLVVAFGSSFLFPDREFGIHSSFGVRL